MAVTNVVYFETAFSSVRDWSAWTNQEYPLQRYRCIVHAALHAIAL
jgi:hypothetical protein